jgi:4-hydroxy-2-oxoglutarate aldolase
MAKLLDISGLYPPIPTPFKENEEIDWDKLKSNIDSWLKYDFSGLVVQGSNGEAVLMSESERVELIRFVRKLLPKPKLLIAGAGMEGTRSTIKMGQAMAEAGADALLVLTPGYFKGVLLGNRMHTPKQTLSRDMD